MDSFSIPGTIGNFPEIGVYGLINCGAVQQGASGTIVFDDGLDCQFEVTERSDGNWCVVLRYTVGRPISVSVDLTTSKMYKYKHRLGGRRWWFRCPNKSCGRRVGKLYLRGEYWCCGKCQQLQYRKWLGCYRWPKNRAKKGKGE